MRASTSEYAALNLRAHALLAGVPLHDVWQLDLPGGGPGRTVMDLRALLAAESLGAVNPLVSALFALRSGVGRVFGWDGDRSSAEASAESFLHRLSSADRAASLIEPGTTEGPFRTLFVSPREALSEVHNATVHAFLVYALVERGQGYRFYWAVYVRPVSRFTAWYMAAIDPFRRWIVYPAILRHVKRAWERDYKDAA